VVPVGVRRPASGGQATPGTNTNSGSNTNTGTNTNSGSNSNSGTNLNNPPGASQSLCESYGGIFAVGTSPVLWTCDGLPDLGAGPNLDRALDLQDASFADGGDFLGSTNSPAFPQDLLCAFD